MFCFELVFLSCSLSVFLSLPPIFPFSLPLLLPPSIPQENINSKSVSDALREVQSRAGKINLKDNLKDEPEGLYFSDLIRPTLPENTLQMSNRNLQ